MKTIKAFTIENREIGPSAPCLLIAEVAQAHDGSLGMAHAFIDAAADVGADAIKFQTHLSEAESTLDEPFRIPLSEQDKSRYDYWKRTEFSVQQWADLAEHARNRNLIFISSPFSAEAVRLLANLNISAWKVGSGEALSLSLIEEIVKVGGPVLLSTGMSRWSEIDATTSHLSNCHVPFALLQCTSQYPTSLDAVGLNVLTEMRKRYDAPIGLSDHSGSLYPALTAIARGSSLIEVHVTFDRRMFGPDTSSSLTFEEFSLLRDARDAICIMDNNPVDKNLMANILGGMRINFGKSLAPVRMLGTGTVLDESMLVMKKPGHGLQAIDLPSVIGRRLIRTVQPDRLLKWDDLES